MKLEEIHPNSKLASLLKKLKINYTHVRDILHPAMNVACAELKCVMKNNNRQYTFTYYRPKNAGAPTKLDILMAYINEVYANDFSSSPEEFGEEVGYSVTPYTPAYTFMTAAYKQSIKSAEAWGRLFASDEADVLDEFYRGKVI